MAAELKGKAFKFGDDISTDVITPGRYLYLRKNLPELAKHAMEDADSTFSDRVQPGDFVVAGKNFGMGSSREHAPLVLKLNGVAAVIAKSCARIFFRNAINLGLPVLMCDTDRIADGDTLRVSLKDSLLVDETTGEQIPVVGLSPAMLRILSEGGVKPFIRKYGSFDVLTRSQGSSPESRS
ncbi:MAG: 3-isopropylmalate dehydratase small subunit [Chloroflexota bacterium]